MAYFEIAWAKVTTDEGGLVDDKKDTGGLTYRGIAQNYNPTWEGWATIEAHRVASATLAEWMKALERDIDLQTAVKVFYRMIWNRIRGDEIENQKVANLLFDTAFNMHERRAVKFLQQSLNALNREGASWPDVDVDGAFGDLTMAAYDAAKINDRAYVVNAICHLRAAYHINSTLPAERKERFLRGWMRRVNQFIEPLN